MPVPGPEVSFERVRNRSLKVYCTVCGRRGYPGGRWQDTCRRGHLPCRNGCGKLIGVFGNGAARRHPSHRCPALAEEKEHP